MLKGFRQTVHAKRGLRMKQLYIIGIGTGNPDHLTMQAIGTLNKADVVLIPRKGEAKSMLAQIRRDICERYLAKDDVAIVEYDVPQRRSAGQDYDGSVDEWHDALSIIHEELLSRHVADGRAAAFLVWGDPSLYDSTIRIIERVRARGRESVDYSVIPGITSIQALTASHRIPLNLVGKPVEITTGRRLASGFPYEQGTAVVMLDGEEAFQRIEDEDVYIYWGAYLGTEHEIVLSGRLSEIAAEISRTRREARDRHGWIMDIYLLRKGQDFDA
jgi:precorrin-6A synthase